MSSPQLNNLTMDWIREYSRLHPSVNFSFRNINENKANKKEGICFISNDDPGASNEVSAWKINIGHNVIVPVVNAKNPMINEIAARGISTTEFIGSFRVTEKLTGQI